MSEAAADTLPPAEIPLRCAEGHRWIETLPMPKRPKTLSARLVAMADCPDCGGRALLEVAGDGAFCDMESAHHV